MVRHSALIVVAALTCGCVATTKYTEPTEAAVANVKTVERPRAQVWDAVVPELAKSFFVINNVDRSSGLINVSYSGNPRSYVDCGRVVIENATPQRPRVEFDGAAPSVTYEAIVPAGLLVARGTMQRSMALEGRVNLVLEEDGPTRTRVTANVQYVLSRRLTATGQYGGSSQQVDTASFTSRSVGEFASAGSQPPLRCRSTGEIERQVLELVR